ncbi:hypothetical protein [Paenisporosarcina cavernae]|uniref:Uncharacterized protein n=1 Tax=Paenisporosarcina cavernae TaxID=2320858 RepID=A0A385YW41_9BACL|nr:hypothetical protein [Paenisporosarcina cavernae]AYC30510.1 hypothetical protein D3873_11955 [Paenisporosarcina cavernae]
MELFIGIIGLVLLFFAITLGVNSAIESSKRLKEMQKELTKIRILLEVSNRRENKKTPQSPVE